jgi:hypothetical protein
VERDVDPSRVQPFQDVRRQSFHDVQLDVRQFAQRARCDGNGEEAADCGLHPEHGLAAAAFPGLRQFQTRGGELRHDVLDALLQAQARIGEAHAAAVAIEHPRADFAFERADVAR